MRSIGVIIMIGLRSLFWQQRSGYFEARDYQTCTQNYSSQTCNERWSWLFWSHEGSDGYNEVHENGSGMTEKVMKFCLRNWDIHHLFAQINKRENNSNCVSEQDRKAQSALTQLHRVSHKHVASAHLVRKPIISRLIMCRLWLVCSWTYVQTGRVQMR